MVSGTGKKKGGDDNKQKRYLPIIPLIDKIIFLNLDSRILMQKRKGRSYVANAFCFLLKHAL